MKKRAVSLLLALVLCLGLAVPAQAAPAETNLPDWYFLFAIFKNVDADCNDANGIAVHTKYSMTQTEVEIIRGHAREFEEYMTSTGVMQAHVDVVEIDTPLTELAGNYVSAELATPFLEEKVNLDKYDHVSCVVSLNMSTGWAGLMTNAYENGAGQATINLHNEEYCLRYYTAENVPWPIHVYVHEFLHVMERMSRKWGSDFGLHLTREKLYMESKDSWQACYTDIILNRVKGDVETGTGVLPLAWQYPPHVLRTLTELTIPSGVTGIGHSAFLNRTNLTSVTIPSSVTYIDGSAFNGCTGLTSVTIPGSVTSIGSFAFAYCSALTQMLIPASVTSIGGAAFQRCSSLTSISLPASITSVEDYTFANCAKLTDIYYSGSEEQWKAIEIGVSNSVLSRAAIHYNSLMADVKTTDWFAKPVEWALGEGVTNGTGNGKFSPYDTCIQAQILTFLWRANGSPAPSGTVSGSEYYAAALQWAKEQGVTSGTVTPNAPCTRADVVTYLWRLAGSPAAGSSGFNDVPDEAPYAQAVAWAVAQKITNGTGNGKFSPNGTCMRGEIVTFLYRALAE